MNLAAVKWKCRPISPPNFCRILAILFCLLNSTNWRGQSCGSIPNILQKKSKEMLTLYAATRMWAPFSLWFEQTHGFAANKKIRMMKTAIFIVYSSSRRLGVLRRLFANWSDSNNAGGGQCVSTYGSCLRFKRTHPPTSHTLWIFQSVHREIRHMESRHG